MKERRKKRVLTIRADNYEAFDKLYNSTADRLAPYEPETRDIDALTTRFYYTETEKIAENLDDDFMQHNERCTCSDCPFMDIGTDARRRWHPCQYASNGETRIDAEACAVFYKEAVRLMRERAGRS